MGAGREVRRAGGQPLLLVGEVAQDGASVARAQSAAFRRRTRDLATRQRGGFGRGYLQAIAEVKTDENAARLVTAPRLRVCEAPERKDVAG
jgi:hypothetical protein